MASRFKAGLVSALVVLGALQPRSGLLCMAEFDEFDEAETVAEVASVVPEARQQRAMVGPDGAIVVQDSTSGDNPEDNSASGEDDDYDEFSSAPTRGPAAGEPRRKRPGKKVKKSAILRAQDRKAKSSSASAEPGRHNRDTKEEEQSYIVEFGGLAALALYLVNFFVGKGSNESKAAAWANRYATVIRDHFYQVGPADGEDLDSLVDEGKYCGALLTKYSQSEFKLYATCVLSIH